ncbi:MAG: bifunctional oligoribonuclease/PAP phosphatase NrnA [Flavobacteriaceae bacterium]|nr:bifunctional oligoribonuclease/PAP phosphatase NrnA [Flavobacteriaceae bacterium]
MDYKEIKSLKTAIENAQNIVIIPHKNPDGDAVGSCVALNEIFESLGKKSTIIAPNDFPEFLKWMDQKNKIRIFEENINSNKRLIENSDVIFTLDFNSLSRIGSMQKYVSECNAIKVMIDHHQEPDNYADFMYSDVCMSSTCEMIYHFLDKMSLVNNINTNIASCIYTGIMTDTGSFRFPLTSETTHKVISTLIKLGANGSKIHDLVYNNNSAEKILLLSHTLRNIVIEKKYNTAYMFLSQDDLNKFNFKKGDTEGIVNYGLSIKKIKFSVIFIENKVENIIKISFRSKGDFDVNKFAREHFNGGGHLNAAGGASKVSLNDTIKKFTQLLPKHKTELCS